MNSPQKAIDLACRQLSVDIESKKQVARELLQLVQFSVDRLDDDRHLVSAKVHTANLVGTIGEISALIKAKKALVDAGKDRYLHIDYGHGHKICLDPLTRSDLTAVKDGVEAIFKIAPDGTFSYLCVQSQDGVDTPQWCTPYGRVIVCVDERMEVTVHFPGEQEELTSLVKDCGSSLILLRAHEPSVEMFDWDDEAGDWRWTEI
jgi:hypothetical protein